MEWARVGTSIDLSPDGTRFVYVGPGDQGCGLWLRQRDRLDATSILGITNAINPRFSPDGQRIAFSAGSLQELKLVGLRCPAGAGSCTAHGTAIRPTNSISASAT
jgi:dipeptidyl aminopeptidase/acylaminoacyl peptidase